MRSRLFIAVTSAVFLFVCALPVAAQQAVPTPAQAQQMLAQPGAAARIRAMVQNSGMSPEQIRERLKAQGYPDSLLDQYLSGAVPDSAALAPPGDAVFEAMRALGLGDSLAVDSLRTRARGRRVIEALADSAFLDTLSRAMTNDTTREAVRRLLRSRAAQLAVPDSGFTRFGMDVFDNADQFDANTAGPVDANYRFVPGDQLTLFLTGDVEKAYPLTVTREGFVVIPEVGQVQVAGLSKAQLDDVLFTRLGRVYSGVRRTGATTFFSVNVSKLGSNQVFVMGDVQQPSSYRISSLGTVLTALYAAKGPTENGSMRNIVVRRSGQVVDSVDLYDYLLRGDATHDVRLQNGDIVFVPPRGPQVRIAGAVLRPATYELKSNETLADLIRMAGGFAANADRQRVQIDRIIPPAQRTSTGSERKTIEVASALLATSDGPPEPLKAGDVVRVFDIPQRFANRVEVKGNVWVPGPVGFTPGMRLSEALRRAGGLKPDSYLGEIQITRVRPDSSRAMLRTAANDTTGSVANDLVLKDGDQIQVFSLSDFRQQRYVTISGAVRKPGRVPYREGMTMRDLVLLAGGVQESALLTEAEIARIPENRGNGVTAVTQRVPLDSTYLFERTADGRYEGPPGVPAPTASAPEVPLEPYDAVLILRQPNWVLQRTVAISGEVRYPGKYALTTKTETLRDLITRAGGLTQYAYADGIAFFRSDKDIGRIGVDLPDVLVNPSSVDNLPLVDGDSIYIPSFTPVVTVGGEVNSPIAVSYVKGANVDYYVRAAGGPTTKADVDRAYVSQPNGKVESKKHHLLWTDGVPKPQPGSTVTVPTRDPTDKTDWAAIATSATSILGALVAIAAIARR
jgi:protein involved in polysaccharide export with SLBB domain